MVAMKTGQSFGFPDATKQTRQWLSFALLFMVVGASAVGCKTKKPPARPQIIFLNRAGEVGPAEERAMATAREEVAKWDSGAQIADVRVQRHTKGWNVSVLLSQGADDAGNPVYPPEPVRNVEINEAGEVTGYHSSH